jgi:hypothetical protein
MVALRSLGKQFTSIIGERGREEVGEARTGSASSEEIIPEERAKDLTPAKAS